MPQSSKQGRTPARCKTSYRYELEGAAVEPPSCLTKKEGSKRTHRVHNFRLGLLQYDAYTPIAPHTGADLTHRRPPLPSKHVNSEHLECPIVPVMTDRACPDSTSIDCTCGTMQINRIRFSKHFQSNIIPVHDVQNHDYRQMIMSNNRLETLFRIMCCL